MTLEQQYKSYLKENPDSKITFNQWKQEVLGTNLREAIDQIGIPDMIVIEEIKNQNNEQDRTTE